MSEESKQSSDQIGQWLKKLERESWQLELLVSAFTIFLLIQAVGAYSELLDSLSYDYDLSNSLLAFLFIFMALLGLSIKALTVFLVIHLMLRGFWIGSIGLRSVQSNVDFDKLNYSDFFTDKLKKKVISLDNLVVMLDEICSLIFSFAFLIMSILLAFGLYILFVGALAFSLASLTSLTTGMLSTVIGYISAAVFFIILISGLIYFIDYFTLGFFKKFKWVSKLYYPFYRFYGMITLSVISKSIYYYLISKFSKKRIRIVYVMAGLVIVFSSLTEYDQFQFYPKQGDEFEILTNQYDNMRPSDRHVQKVSIQSNIVNGDYLQLYLRYDPEDNEQIRSNCPDYTPAKQDGLNWSLKVDTRDGNFLINAQQFEDENKRKLLECLSKLYRVSVNDSIYQEQKYYYFNHPTHSQKGLVTMLNTTAFKKGENVLRVKKVTVNEDGLEEVEDFAHVPFWIQ